MMKNQSEQSTPIGGGYKIQPRYKRKIQPHNYLEAFYNINPADHKKVLAFCNNYAFPTIWALQGKGLFEQFSELHAKYRPIIKRLILTNKIANNDLLVINEGLNDTKFLLAPRNSLSEVAAKMKGFSLFTLESSGEENPTYKLQFSGHPRTDKITAKIVLIIQRDKNSTADWYYREIPNGTSSLEKEFPNDAWVYYRDYFDQIVVNLCEASIDKNGKVLSLIHEIKFSDQALFAFDELTAGYSILSFDAFICKEIWDYIMGNHILGRYKLCTNCGQLHRGGSQYHCDRSTCKRAWESKKQRLMRRRKSPL